MKINFNSLDIACCIYELQGLVGMRVNQVYDVDHKTYLFKLHRNEEKCVLLMESGIRFHTTAFDWPKNASPSGFTMKLRKHLRNKRIECIRQLGTDRIVDFQFGCGEATYHVILELFNRGNVILTDNLLVILNVLRPHTEGDKFKFSVKEEYPISRVRDVTSPPIYKLPDLILNAKIGERINKILLPHFDYGAGLIDHIITCAGLPKHAKIDGKMSIQQIDCLAESILLGEEIYRRIKVQPTEGYLIMKRESRFGREDLITYTEFHPYMFYQHAGDTKCVFPTFNEAVDEYFSKREGQKIELKALNLEREALQKVETIRENQQQRVQTLISSQENNRQLAELIMSNSELVDEVICTVRRAISIQMSWPDISLFFAQLAQQGHPVALAIKKFKLEINHITVSLSNPYIDNETEENEDEKNLNDTLVDIDLALSAHANASKYYINKKTAALKEKKTVESQEKALKNAEKKARQTLKDIQNMTTITKSRKVYWFEKFFWFISSDNYVVIGGRDQQQNELIVKKYLKKGDLYVHADLHGASSIIIKNPSGESVPPRTLNEAGNMAVCYSIGWEAKVMCSAWWVHYDQVTKTAPSGEYLTTGRFMIRGQKNYLLPAQLAMGFAFMFRVEESSVFRHKEERKPKMINPEDLPKGQEDYQEETDEEIKNSEASALAQSFDDDDCILVHPIIDDDIDSDDLAEAFSNANIHLTETFGQISLKTFPSLRSPTLTIKSDIVQENTEITDKLKTQKNDKEDEKDKKEKFQQTCKTPVKRGHRSKLKKIKEKYKDQDEEEKQLRMSILQPAGPKKETKKAKNTNSAGPVLKEKKPPRVKKPAQSVKEPTNVDTFDSEELLLVDLDVMDYLTGQPHPDDELLFAIPVVAPYSTLVNYKYKVKMMPGNGKRGKCSRQAVDYFIHLKECSPQEKTLIKNVNDQILSRNFPGKVKLRYGPARK